MSTLRQRLESMLDSKPKYHIDDNEEEDAQLPTHTYEPDKGAKRSALRTRSQFEADMEDMGPKYSGVVLKSAKRALASGIHRKVEEEDEDDDDDEEEEEEEEEEDEDLEDEDIEDEDGEEGEDGDDDSNEGEDEEDEEDEGEEDEEDGEEDEEDDDDDGSHPPAPAAEAEEMDPDAELLSLMAADTSALSMYRASDREDRVRGKEVAAQTGAIEAMVESRIRLQATLVASQRLPRTATHAALCASHPGARAGFTAVRDVAAALLVDLLGVRAELWGGGAGGEAGKARLQPPPFVPTATATATATGTGTAPTSASAPPPTSTAQLWECLARGWEDMAGHREETLDIIARRVALGGGVSAARAAKMRVLGGVEGFSASARAAWEHSKALGLGYARGEGVVPRALCHATATATGGSGGSGSGSGSGSVVVDSEVWEDSDFYASLLKDFLAGGGDFSDLGAGSSSSTAAAAARPKLKSVKKSGVDRRASKARKLRYVAHPQIVNFAAPSPYLVPPELAMDLDTLLKSLFQ